MLTRRPDEHAEVEPQDSVRAAQHGERAATPTVSYTIVALREEVAEDAVVGVGADLEVRLRLRVRPRRCPVAGGGAKNSSTRSGSSP